MVSTLNKNLDNVKKENEILKNQASGPLFYDALVVVVPVVVVVVVAAAAATAVVVIVVLIVIFFVIIFVLFVRFLFLFYRTSITFSPPPLS